QADDAVPVLTTHPVRRFPLFTRIVFQSMVVWMGASLFLGSVLFGQDHPTAQQLYEQGMQQLADGDLESAKATLVRVDPLQLPREERTAMREALDVIDQQL